MLLFELNLLCLVRAPKRYGAHDDIGRLHLLAQNRHGGRFEQADASSINVLVLEHETKHSNSIQTITKAKMQKEDDSYQ